MKLYIRFFLILSLIFSLSNVSMATHVSGGDISYTCVGQDSFLISLNVFRDCAGTTIGATTTVNFTSTCGGSATATLTRQSITEISQLCAAQLPNSTCNGGSWPGMEANVFTGIVVLSPPCNTWTMSWSLCCRNNQISNLTNPGTLDMYIYTTMYSGVDSCNTSPVFTSLPIPYVCMNQVVNYNFGVVEPDGDSIVYFLSPGFESATALVPYDGTYTFLQPFPGANATINAFNGQLTFNATATGVYVIVVRIEEYDIVTGVIKGTSIRDIQVVVQNCTNEQPTVDSPGIYNFTGSGTQIDSNTVEVCIGDSFSFDFSLSDTDSLQTISLYHNIYAALDSTAIITITNGNPATINVKWTAQPGSPSFAAFTITGIDDACPVSGLVSAVFNVIINPSTYAGVDQSICQGTQWADLQVVGGTQFTWTTISGTPIDTVATSPNFNMTCWHCDNPSVSPAVTTTYVVYSNMITTCKSIDTITIVVNPNFNLFMPNDTLICPIDTITLVPFTDQPSFSYTYLWRPSGPLSNDTIINPSVFLADPTRFTLTVAAAGGCIKSGKVFVDLAPPFPMGITVIGDTVICLGDSTMLTASLGDVSPSSCGLSSTPCIGNISEGIIGTDVTASTNTSYPSPYGRFYWGVRHQMLFTVAELNAMGMTSGGKIKSVAFDVVGVGNSTNFENFEVKMGCTSATDLSTAWETGLVTVLPSYTYNVSMGWNTHSFANSYDWDGVSNLVVEICYHNSNWSSAATATTTYTTTPFQSVRYYRADNATVCGNTNTTGVSADRPNIKFEYCVGADPLGYNFTWSPNNFIDSINIQTPVVYPPGNQVYQVVVQDTFGSCYDTITHIIEVVTEFDPYFIFPDTICYNGGPQQAMPFIGGGIFSGIGLIDSLLGIIDPLIPGVGTSSLSYSVSSPTGGCMSDTTIDYTIIPPPDATFSPQEFCLGAGPAALIPVLPGGYWGGTGIADTALGIFDPIGLPAGSYPITYTLTQPCVNTDTQIVKIIEPYTFTFDQPVLDVCEGGMINLNTNYILSSHPNQGSGPIAAFWSGDTNYVDVSGTFDASIAPPGDYTVTLQIEGLDGTCGSVQSMTVRVQPIYYPSSTGDLAFCSDNKSAKIFINPWLYGTGMSFLQTPIAPKGAIDTLNITPYGQNAQFDATIHGIGQWQLEMTWVNSFGCVGVTIDTIHVLDTPEPASPIAKDYCEGDEIILTAIADVQDSVYWYSDFLMTDTIGIGSPTNWGIAPDPEDGEIKVWATQNNWACISGKTLYILPIKESPTASFEMTFTDTTKREQVNIPHTDSPIYGFTPFLVDFTALNTVSSDVIAWYHHAEIQPPLAQHINKSNSIDARFIYSNANIEEDGTILGIPFINQLVVTNEFGCNDTARATIYSVASENFFNVFTPNGDGINDVYYLPVFGVKDYKAEIFNRWGKRVFEWTDPSEGWKGEDQPNGVYFYTVTGIKNDAMGTPYKKQGTVTLTGLPD